MESETQNSKTEMLYGDKVVIRNAGAFPDTLWSLVTAAGSPSSEQSANALGKLCEIYHKPILNWLTASGMNPDEAEDATQDFIAHLLTRSKLGCTPGNGSRFRTYLLACLHNFLSDRNDAKRAQKRGGAVVHVNIQEIPLAAPNTNFDHKLDAEFAGIIHNRAFSTVRESWTLKGKQHLFDGLSRFLLVTPEKDDYAQAGEKMGLVANQIKRHVFTLREDYLDAFRHEVALTVMPEELANEIEYLINLVACP